MKIAVLSDSHRKPNLTKEALDILVQNGAQYIIHAGDLEIKENLELLKNSNLPYISVFGNNDYNLIQYQDEFNIHKEPYYFKIEDLTFKLMHLPYYLSGDTDIVIFGHTHQFESSYTNNTLFLNPGEVCARNKPLSEAVLLEIKDDQYIINHYYTDPNNIKWEKRVINYAK